MKDMNDILTQFDDLQSLPVSEEMLGAHIEGTLDPLEELEVSRICESSPLAGEIVAHSQPGTPVGQPDFIDDVELSALDDIDFELPEIPDDGGAGVNEDMPGDTPEEAAAFEQEPLPEAEVEGYTEPSPFEEYGEAGPDEPDFPFTEDFLQPE